jgi:hypothetical protein
MSCLQRRFWWFQIFCLGELLKVLRSGYSGEVDWDDGDYWARAASLLTPYGAQETENWVMIPVLPEYSGQPVTVVWLELFHHLVQSRKPEIFSLPSTYRSTLAPLAPPQTITFEVVQLMRSVLAAAKPTKDKRKMIGNILGLDVGWCQIGCKGDKTTDAEVKFRKSNEYECFCKKMNKWLVKKEINLPKRHTKLKISRGKSSSLVS